MQPRKPNLPEDLALDDSGLSPARRVDPAALLVAVVAVGVGPLFESGEWSFINTAVAGLVLVIILCFVLPTRPTLLKLPLRQRLPLAIAQSFATGFVAAIGSAWLIQIWQGIPTGSCGTEPQLNQVHFAERYFYFQQCLQVRGDQVANEATKWTALPGAAAGVLVMIWLTLPWRTKAETNVSDVSNSETVRLAMSTRGSRASRQYARRSRFFVVLRPARARSVRWMARSPEAGGCVAEGDSTSSPSDRDE
jgi:hypothetical protein